MPKSNIFVKRLSDWLSPPKKIISEIIGRTSWLGQSRIHQSFQSIDYTETNYEWYDKFRRGKQPGFEIGGLFANPMAEIIASWSLSDGFELETENGATKEAFGDFLADNLELLVENYMDSLCLGDSFIVVNPDGLLQRIAPDQVTIKRDELDFTKIVEIKVCTINDAISIEDIYTAESRTVRIKRGGVTEEMVFPNLIGRIPIIPFFNDRGANETNGHPFFEALLTLFADYNDVIRGGVDGVKLMGNPIPVVEGLEDAQGALRLNRSYSTTYVDKEGNTQSQDVMELAPNKVYFFGKGANFKYAAPGNFSDNMNDVLKKLFYVMLQHAKIPEWVWGGAIASSMASVEAQAPAFVKFIQGQQRKLESALKELLEVYFATISLFEPVPANEEFSIHWPEILPSDKELMLKWAQWLKEGGMLSKETALRTADIVDDIAGELERADAEGKVAQAQAARLANREQAVQFRRNAQTNGQAQANGSTIPTPVVDNNNPPPQ